MAETIDFRFQVLQTVCHVCYCSLARIEADALVNSDDVYLSMSSGLSAQLRKAAGDGPRQEAKKHALPLPAGSVVVTGSGHLRAKYIFHALLLDYDKLVSSEILLPSVVRRIMDLSQVLGIERLAVPVVLTQGSTNSDLVTQLARVPETKAINLILQGVACYLATQETPGALREFTIALYLQDAEDQAAAEALLFKTLTPIREQIDRWAAGVEPLNRRLALLYPLLALSDDPELRRSTNSQISEDVRAMCDLFGCSPIANSSADELPEDELEPRSAAEFAQLTARLSSLIDDLREEEQSLREVMRAARKRRSALLQRQAQQGFDTPPEVDAEIDEIEGNLQEYNRQLADGQAQQERASSQLARITERWNRHHS